MAKISVIIPVYNVKEYLGTCIQSVQEQSFADWELLLINDGSTDGSGELCRRFASDDKRIRVLDQENAGAGMARNAGLDAASGEYITFLDGDDAYEREHLRSLLTLAEKTHADICAVGAECVSKNEGVWTTFAPSPGVFRGREAILRQFLCHSRGLYCCWNKLFRSEILKNLRFRSYTRAEDAVFCVEALLHSDVYAVGKSITYRYFRNPDSVTMSGVKASTLDQVKAWEEITSMLEEVSAPLGALAAEKLVREIDSLYLAYGRERPQGWRECRRFLKNCRLHSWLRRYPGVIPQRARIAQLVYSVSPALYYRLAAR